LRRVRFRKRPAENGEVLREDVHQAPVDAAVAGDETVARRPLLLHPEVGALVADELVEFFERAFVKQQPYPLARAHLALFVLALATLGASALLCFGVALAEFFEAVEVFGVLHWFWSAHSLEGGLDVEPASHSSHSNDFGPTSCPRGAANGLS